MRRLGLALFKLRGSALRGSALRIFELAGFALRIFELAGFAWAVLLARLAARTVVFRPASRSARQCAASSACRRAIRAPQRAPDVAVPAPASRGGSCQRCHPGPCPDVVFVDLVELFELFVLLATALIGLVEGRAGNETAGRSEILNGSTRPSWRAAAITAAGCSSFAIWSSRSSRLVCAAATCD